MKEKILTLREMYKEGADDLARAGIRDAGTDAWYLLEYVTGINRASYYGSPDRELSREEEERYRDLLKKRAGHLPLQHITGEQAFMGFTFLVNENVLIPRQDTEVLVEEALTHLKSGMEVLDLCTGSGCILISLLKLCQEITGTGSDISEKALETAEENGRRLGVEERVKWVKSDLFDRLSGSYDLIVSNPPYIRTEVIEELQEEVRLHDPRIALDGREDGLFFYRQIARESRKYMKQDGWLALEIGHDQAEAVAGLLDDAGYTQIQVKKDLAGLDRVVTGRYNKNCA
ncbi:peptide chain release factor N(5)-glutamine methyltransferase [uncultured Merdimonas sp.]|uniref:peptide chain release factor N(5)-glutamine methyltransferase n=1 Tax=uncultured Merdimonas sp. TaxID=2023269 RepID=UPI0032088DDD